jgi:pimeloyl-ACP methyl ester carboxylesterase
VTSTSIETRKGTRCTVIERGPASSGDHGDDVLFLHGAGGLAGHEPLLDAIASNDFRVVAAELPGYGESTGEELLEDMLDFALHGWDVADALGMDRPHLLGHSMGGMIAAEMACISSERPRSLSLIAPAGLWLDEHPIPDIFALLPHELPGVLFHDAAAGAAALTGGVDFSDTDALVAFFVDNARRLGTAGKLLFPIPNRRLSKRLYRLAAPVLLVWGESDRLVPAGPYAARWQELIPGAELVTIGEAGHMVTVERPDEVAAAVTKHLRSI